MAYDYEAGYSKIADRIRENAQKAVQKIMPGVYRDWLVLIRQNVERIYSDVVESFYNDYSPVEYRRNYSLADLLQAEAGKDYLDLSFDTSRMTPFRSGYRGVDGLFDQVFMKGWHGGANKGDYSTFVRFNGDMSYEQKVYTPHPAPGTPYWREPIPFYTNWGRPAEIATISPYQDYTQRVEQYQTSQDGIYADYYKAWTQNEHKLNYNL